MDKQQDKKKRRSSHDNNITRLSQPRIHPIKESEMDENAKNILKPAKALGRGRYLNIFT
jgi:hypothetical protein